MKISVIWLARFCSPPSESSRIRHVQRDSYTIHQRIFQWSPNPQPNVAGTPFWNNYSPDIGVGGSHNENIGYALRHRWLYGYFFASVGRFPRQTLLGAAEPPNSFMFTSNGSTYTIQVLFSDTALPDAVTVGWYDQSTPSILNPIFSNINNTSSPIPPPQTFTHNGSSQYGFYATVCYNPPRVPSPSPTTPMPRRIPPIK